MSRFRVALSFSGRKRPYIDKVAAYLARSLGKQAVLYDLFHEAEFAKPNLDIDLQRLYHDHSDLIAVFISAEYQKNDWCGLEWRGIRDLINRRQAFKIMLLRFDETPIEGLFDREDGYAWVGTRTPAEIGRLILKRLPGPSNLSAELDSFVGRDADRRGLSAHLLEPGRRLVTLIGPPGVGKSRLALRAADENRGLFADGAFAVALQTVRRADLIAPAIARALNLGDQGSQPVLRTLTEYLADKQLLLILDNFEQLLTHRERQDTKVNVATLLRDAPRLKILITSRTSLDIEGEFLWRLEPFPVSAARQGAGVMLANESDAVRLFLDRAKSFISTFELTEANASAVAEICGRLEGLPLSIELAAARLQNLTVHDLLVQLQNRLELLKRSDRSLRSSLEVSYGLLDSSAQALLRRLSVFAGGVDLHAVLCVCSMSAAAEAETQDALLTLTRSSLVVFNPDANRYALLETIREYALEKLGNGSDAAVLRQAHANYYASLAEKIELRLRGSQQIDWLTRLNVDLENFRAAFQWACERAEVVVALRLSGFLANGFWMNGNSGVGLRWLETSLELADGAGLVAQCKEWAKAVFYAGLLAWEQGKHELGASRWTKSLSVAEQFADPWLQDFTACWLGLHAGTVAHDPKALTDLEKATEQFRSLDDIWGEGFAHLCLGEAQRALEKYDLANDSYERSLQCWLKTGEVWWQGAILHNLGYLRRRAGLHNEARRLFQDSLRLFAQLKSHWSIAYSLTALVGSAVDKEQWSRALRLAAAAETIFKMAGVVIQPADQREYGRDLALARERMSKRMSELSWKRGEVMTLDQVITLALRR